MNTLAGLIILGAILLLGYLGNYLLKDDEPQASHH